jgi:hypothetical protein
MKTCPACSKLGIGEHSVLILLDPPRGQSRARAMAAYTRCAECGAAFRFDGPDTLQPEPAASVSGRVAWIVPPWAVRNTESEFELSWDNLERAVSSLAREQPDIESMVSLIGDLRGVGLGSRLRATLAEGSITLSRSRNAALRPEQQFVALDPQPGGAVKVRAKLARELGFGPVPASYGGDLKLVVDALLSAKVD